MPGGPGQRVLLQQQRQAQQPGGGEGAGPARRGAPQRSTGRTYAGASQLAGRCKPPEGPPAVRGRNGGKQLHMCQRATDRLSLAGNPQRVWGGGGAGSLLSLAKHLLKARLTAYRQRPWEQGEAEAPGAQQQGRKLPLMLAVSLALPSLTYEYRRRGGSGR